MKVGEKNLPRNAYLNYKSLVERLTRHTGQTRCQLTFFYQPGRFLAKGCYIDTANEGVLTLFIQRLFYQPFKQH